jgi:hypothetical protein
VFGLSMRDGGGAPSNEETYFWLPWRHPLALERRPLHNAGEKWSVQQQGSPAGCLTHVIERELDELRGGAALAVGNTGSHIGCGYSFRCGRTWIGGHTTRQRWRKILSVCFLTGYIGVALVLLGLGEVVGRWLVT